MRLTPPYRSILLALCIACITSACGRFNTTSTASFTSANRIQSVPSKQHAADRNQLHRTSNLAQARVTGPFRVALVTTTSGLGDRGFNHLAYLGLLRAESQLHVETAISTPNSSLDFANTLESYAAQGYSLVIASGYLMENAVRQAAKDYPNTQFVILDDTVTGVSNVTGVTFRTEESGYLAGALAGLMEERDNKLPAMNAQNVIGIVGGVPSPQVNTYIAGFVQGVKRTDPTATILKKFTNTFTDVSVGWNTADEEIVDGADIIFQVASHAGTGVFQACRQSGIYAIGVETNESYLDPDVILTSAIKGLDTATYEVIREAEQKQLKSGQLTMSVVNGGVRLSPLLPIVPKRISTIVQSLNQDISNGTIQVSPNMPSATPPGKKK